MDRWGARTSVMWACACRAMTSCTAGRMTRSAVPTTAQEGMVFQAGTPLFWPSAMVDSGSPPAGGTPARRLGRAAEHPGLTERQTVGEAGGEQVLLVIRVEHAGWRAGVCREVEQGGRSVLRVRRTTLSRTQRGTPA